MIGRTLAHYHVTEKLGAGGMGEVYRARDTRLNRDVALKFLPTAFAQDPERLARFEREAHLLAQLNHQNIAAIYGFEQDRQECLYYLVLEYVPGQTLPCPVPLEDVLPILRQLIDALEEAHEAGIVHRDLKPANIKITPEGKLKVLDFGLAKALADEPAGEVASNSPTLAASALTRGAMLLGTAAYMSPEQARGKRADKRSDIFAFGSVLYEMLAGKQAFGGETISDSLAAILTKEPDRSLLPEATPAKLRRLLDRCLEKDLRLRLRDIGEARILLDTPEPAEVPRPLAPDLRPPARWRAVWALSTIALAAGAGVAAWALLRAPKPVQRPVTRLATALPEVSARLLQPAVSFDGARLAYRAGSPLRIYLRMMDQVEAKPIAGTDNPFSPFFSPDGQWIGFFQDSKVKKVLALGGATMTLCDAVTGFTYGPGGSWGADGNIVFTAGPGAGLARVSAAGGKPQTLTTPDAKKGERSHRWPAILPGGRAVLFTIEAGAGFNDARIAVLTLETGEQRVLLEGGTRPGYVPTGPGPDGRGTGHIVYYRAGSLFAVPFDLDRLQVLGSPVPILEGVAGFALAGSADYTFSDSGALVYTPGGSESNSTLVWVDRQGQTQPLPAPSQFYSTPRLSPDGQRVAVSIGSGDQADIWVYDLERKTLTRLTFQGGAQYPAWTPDGKRVTFYVSRGTERKEAIYSVVADGSSPPQTLAAVDTRAAYLSWSPDGKALAFTLGAVGQTDLAILPAEGDRKVKPFLQTQAAEYAPEFSPDGRWIAYTSQETGRTEIYVRPAPAAAGSGVAAGAKWQVSNDGGRHARWARGGRELFYVNGDKMMGVEIEPGPAFRARTPKMLFEGRYQTAPGNYDVTADGKRFLMLRPGAGAETGPAQVHVVLEWFEEIRRRVRAGS